MKLAGLNKVTNAHDESISAMAWVRATEERPALLLTGSLDRTVRLWRPDGLTPAGLPSWFPGVGVTSIAAHPAGTVAVAASMDSFIQVFIVDSSTSIATLEVPRSEVWSMQFDPKGTVLAVSGGVRASVKLWDTSTWQPIANLPVPFPRLLCGTNKYVVSVAWSPDGKRLACGSLEGTTAVFDVASEKFLHHLEGHFGAVRSLAFSPVDPRVLFTACEDRHVRMYDADGKSMVGAMSGHVSCVVSVDASPDGAAIVTGSSDKTVRLWDLSMRAAVQTMTNHSADVRHVAFWPPVVHAVRVASVSDDKSISLYDYS